MLNNRRLLERALTMDGSAPLNFSVSLTARARHS